MPSLPVISGARCIRVLERAGYHSIRQRGSHVRLNAVNRAPITVPLHAELDRGTLRSILRTADLTVEEFLALLESA